VASMVSIPYGFIKALRTHYSNSRAVCNLARSLKIRAAGREGMAKYVLEETTNREAIEKGLQDWKARVERRKIHDFILGLLILILLALLIFMRIRFFA